MADKKSERKGARENYEKVAKKSKPGSGARFEAVEKSAKASGAKNPAAVAASAGIEKYGKRKMSEMAAKGRERMAKTSKKVSKK